jgi:uncharacterized protein YxeA
MKKKIVLILGVLVLLLIGTGLLVYRTLNPKSTKPIVEETEIEQIAPADPSITVTVIASRSRDNTIVIRASNLAGKYSTVAYELTYESAGLIKGVNSGSKPIPVAGVEAFEREVYMGTCSRNVCKPDPGVTAVSVVLEFVDSEGKKSQFSKDFTLT